MSRTDNPVADFERHDRRQAAELDRLPKCGYCDETVQDDYYFEIEGEIICEGCLIKHFRKAVDEYVG